MCVCGNHDCKIPFGYCHCGCGNKVPVKRFVFGHRNRNAFKIHRRFGPRFPRPVVAQPDDRPVRYLSLTQGQVAIVDVDVYAKVKDYLYFARRRSSGGFYAWRYENPSRKMIGLHNDVLPTEPGLVPDHRNGDGLDNRLANLRPATPQQNLWNSKKRSTNTSGHTGVRRRKEKFIARITANGVDINLGSFDTAEEASAVYKAKARELRGEFCPD